MIGYTLGEAGWEFAAGWVRVFRWEPSKQWSKLGNDVYGTAAYDYSGASVAASNDGNTIAVGTPESDRSKLNLGHAFVYYWNSTLGSWIQKGNKLIGVNASQDLFGEAISISDDGNVVAVAGRNI